MSHDSFKEGDLIAVTMGNGTVIKGTALDSRGQTGFAGFRIKPELGAGEMEFNLNFVDVTLLFSADHARSMTPPAGVPYKVAEAAKMVHDWLAENR